MSRVCVDASLVITLLLPEEGSGRVQALWSQWQREQAVPFGPPLLYAEVPSVLRRAVFYGRLTPTLAN